MTKRLVDLLAGGVLLVLAAPILAAAAVGIRLSSPGPVFYRAARAGRHGRPFTMYKLRTMHGAGAAGTRITATGDARVFGFGRLLRRTKVDELPQLLNVVLGDMSLVGPRPEDPAIVAERYAPAHRPVLSVRPGLTSPGTLYHDTHCVALIGREDPERGYLAHVFPIKTALDLVYLERASLGYDLRLLARTAWVLLGRLLGRTRFPDPPELVRARTLVVPARADGVAREPVPAPAPVPPAPFLRLESGARP